MQGGGVNPWLTLALLFVAQIRDSVRKIVFLALPSV